MQCNMFSFKYCCEWGIFFLFISCFVFKFGFFFLHLVPFICHTQIKTLRRTYIQVWHVSYLFVLLWVRILPAFILYHIFVCALFLIWNFVLLNSYPYIFIHTIFCFFRIYFEDNELFATGWLVVFNCIWRRPPLSPLSTAPFCPFHVFGILIFFKFCFSRLFR